MYISHHYTKKTRFSMFLYGTIRMSMQYDFTLFKDREKEILDWLGVEYTRIQSGRITTALLDRTEVQAYGAKTALNHCTAIAIEDPKTLTVTPYDITLLPEIEAALREQLPTMEMAVGETTIRVIAPDLTGERRALLEKSAQERMEEARQSIRGVREKILTDIKQKKTSTELSEDEEFSVKEELQKKIETANKNIEEMYEKKLKDIQT